MVIVIVLVVVAALLVAITWGLAQRRRGDRGLDLEAPLPLFSSRAHDGSGSAHAQPHVEPAEVALLRRGRLASSPALPPRDENGAYPQHLDERRGAAVDDGGTDARSITPTGPQRAVEPGSPVAPLLRPEHEDAAKLVLPEVANGSAPVPPPPGTIQFLPGRLELVQGLGAVGQEVRFVRPGPGERPEVTFGRGEGLPYRHVQLRAPTVSRLHARLTLLDGQAWMLENLSLTNPVVLNGVEIRRGAKPCPLTDGDLIEMGEVVFRFRVH